MARVVNQKSAPLVAMRFQESGLSATRGLAKWGGGGFRVDIALGIIPLQINS
jgi:hypothetical protein